MTDDRSLPLVYGYGVGSADITRRPTYLSVLRSTTTGGRPPNLTVSLGLRYDVDTQRATTPTSRTRSSGGPRARGQEQLPAARSAFSWDVGNQGKSVLRGGVGVFTGRYLLVPSFTELQQNGVTGRDL